MQFGGDLRQALAGSIAGRAEKSSSVLQHRRSGRDRIFLFAHAAPVAAVPSNCPHVLVRILHGAERENYGATYREAQELIDAEVPAHFHARQRTYLLLKSTGSRSARPSRYAIAAAALHVRLRA